MPTPNYHGGARLAHIPLTVPGFKGLNTQARGALLGPEWATRLENTIIDSQGRVTARRGWDTRTTVAHGKAFIQGIEYIKTDGEVNIVVTTEDEVLLSSNGGSTFSDITDSATFTEGDWHLVNFRDQVVGFQLGYAPFVTDGSTTGHISGGPEGGVGTAAFGRLWGVDDDGVTIMYSDLLSTAFSGGSSGSIDMSDIWPGNDHVKAIAAYNNVLVVFGSRNTIVFADETGSEVGIDPANMTVIDTVPGVGCMHQYTVQIISGDLWFLANNREMMSLGRVLVEQKSGSLSVLSRNVSDFLRDSIDSGSFDIDRIRSAWLPKERVYLLSLPVTSAPGVDDEIGKTFVFDTRGQLEDGSARCLGVWNQMVPTVMISRLNGDLLSALQAITGELGLYSNGLDYEESYRMIYESGWLDPTDSSGLTLILKRINGLFFFDLTTVVSIKWAFDFSTIFQRAQLLWETTGGNAQWGLSEWGVAEWGGGIDLSDKRVSGSGTGEYIKVGMEATIAGGQFSIQQIDLLAKVGRLKG